MEEELKQVHKPLEFHGVTKGGKQPPLYQIWSQIKQRCLNENHPKYKNYGGRGIDMDPRWEESFIVFRDEVPPRPSKKHTIERIDNDKGYWPGNVRWATRIEQNRNKRTSRYVEFKGKEIVLAQLADDQNKNRKRVQARLDAGWSAEDAIARPLRKIRATITWRGKSHNLVEWSKILGMSYQTLRSRIYNKKWSIEKAFTTPVDESKAHA